MWETDSTEEFDRRVRRFTKNHPRELQAVLTNLHRLQKALDEGANPQNLPLGFIHREARGVLAIDQKGGGSNLAQTRLYVYLDPDSETIHLITLGDKSSQKDDVKFSSQFAESLRSQKDEGESHG
jgi:hypothetical protein